MFSRATRTTQVVPAASTDYRLISGWTDNKATRIGYRYGTTAWGWLHIQPHNVTNTMVKKTTQFPRSRTVSGTTITYVTPANEFTCWLTVCWITRTMDVQVVVNSSPRLSDGYPKGVISAYCVGANVCPSWVVKVAG
ncbi:MAG: hypothetical protein QM626_06735 [Microbacterium sp.]|uniref:hypothetical protein n=1 Tax=Microbacterium sp. TaxID=51671 RepID=UPI0039E3DD1C